MFVHIFFPCSFLQGNNNIAGFELSECSVKLLRRSLSADSMEIQSTSRLLELIISQVQANQGSSQGRIKRPRRWTLDHTIREETECLMDYVTQNWYQITEAQEE